jgi:NADH-quinone oxidoreductase subunit N
MIFAVLGAISMTLGNVVAIAQSNIKRMLAYSSIANAGYLMVGLAAVGSLGRSGVLFFLATYALANLGAFIAIIAISNKTNSDEITDYAGMARRAPMLALVLTICLVSLIGIPPTGGFIAKFYIFNAAIQHNLLWLVIIAVINSVISAYYYLRVVKVMYTEKAASEEAVASSVPLQAALTITSLGVLLLGIYPWVVLRLAEVAVTVFSP